MGFGCFKYKYSKFLWGFLIFGMLIIWTCCGVHAGDNELVTEQYTRMQDEMRALKKDLNDQYFAYAPESIRTTDSNAMLRIGGEIFTDYIGSVYGGNDIDGTQYDGGWATHNSNLRFDFHVNETLRASVKLDLSDCPYSNSGRMMEEAMIIMDAVCGGPIGLFFGVGEVPYGQDRTLGIIQSYNHTEGNSSSEGPIILSAPVFAEYNNRNSVVYHPGEIDRVVMAGLSYTWEDAIKVEFAFYQASGLNDIIGGYDRVLPDGDTGFESFAGRVWWNTPVDGMVVELSGLRKYERQRGDKGLFGEKAVDAEYAVSVGVDWDVNNQLEIFAEYQHGFNWGFKDGYDTDTISIGSRYDITDKITLGAMVEWLHISDNGDITDLNKFVLHTQYDFDNGLYLIAEYGLELYNWDGAMTNMFAIRSGMSF